MKLQCCDVISEGATDDDVDVAVIVVVCGGIVDDVDVDVVGITDVVVDVVVVVSMEVILGGTNSGVGFFVGYNGGCVCSHLYTVSMILVPSGFRKHVF